MNTGLADCLLALFTLALVVVGVLQFLLLRHAFHVDHRPEVQVRHIKLLSDVSKDYLQTRPLEFEIVIVNKGAGDATVYKSTLTSVLDRTANPLFEKSNTITDSILSGKLASGAMVSPRFSLDYQRDGLSLLLLERTTVSLLARYLVLSRQDRPGIYNGLLSSLDMAPQTAGIQGGRNRFIGVLDPEYEYAD